MNDKMSELIALDIHAGLLTSYRDCDYCDCYDHSTGSDNCICEDSVCSDDYLDD